MTLRRAGRFATFVCSAIGVVGAAAPPCAAASHNDHVAVARVDAAPALSDPISSPAWGSGLRIDTFFDVVSRRTVASGETAAKISYDGRYLYAVFRCAQPARTIVAKQRIENGALDVDDHVEVDIDTSGNGSRWYSFGVSPLGTHSATSSENARYNPHWSSTAVVSDEFYQVAMAIPLSALRFPSAPDQKWRINVVRYIAGTNQIQTWAYEPTQPQFPWPSAWPWIDGIRITPSAVRPPPSADVFALASAGSERSSFANGTQGFSSVSSRPLGADLIVPLSGTASFIGTISPDFSNVERDQATIAPQEFVRRLAEYRPFFAQGAKYINALPSFGTQDVSLFYSPAIGVFNQGLKLEGTQGRSSAGILDVSGDDVHDTALGYKFSTPSQSLTFSAEGVLANHLGLRDQAVGAGIYVANARSGAFASVRAIGESGSTVSDPPSARSLYAIAGVQTQSFSYSVGYQDIGAQFAPADAYVPLNDLRGPEIQMSYVGAGKRAIQSYDVSAFADRYLDRSGAVRQADIGVQADVTFKSLLSLGVSSGASELTTYAQGFPSYSGRDTEPYNAQTVTLGYRANTPNASQVFYGWGPFGGAFTQQFGASTTAHLAGLGVYAEYDGSLRHSSPALGTADSQWLRRIAVSKSFGKSADLALAYREINGSGGFAAPGGTLSFIFHKQFANFDQLYVAFGSPDAVDTLHRLVFKYVFHVGGTSK